MKRLGLREWVFSFNCFVAAALALFIGFRIGLPRPSWSMLTVYIVSQPLSGSLRSKAAYRLLGTTLGGVVAVLLVPNLVNAPELLSLALSLLVGFALYVAFLDRTPRSYVFTLAGYTAAIIGFPSVSEPTAVFATAVARVEEISLGIICATVVHSVVLPRTVTETLNRRIDRFLEDAERWTLDALSGRTDLQERRDRHRLAADIAELRTLSTHLPFDTSRLRPTAQSIRALQERMGILIPILSSVEDRLAALQSEARPLPPALLALLADLRGWIRSGEVSPDGALQLQRSCTALAPALGPQSDWQAVLLSSLSVRLRELVETFQDLRALRSHIRDPATPIPQRLEAFLHERLARPLHRDYGLALLSGTAAMLAVLGCCVFWIATAWPEGGSAAVTAAIYSSLYATRDDPVTAILSALRFTLASFPTAAFYLFVILPRIDGFVMLLLVLAPTLLILGVLIAHPSWAARASAFMLGFGGTLALQGSYTADVTAVLNSSVAQAVGFLAAAQATYFLRSLGASWSAHRILLTEWRELAQLAVPGPVPDRAAWTSRALDRLGLLSPQLAREAPDEANEATDALNDLRIGLNLVDLQRIRAEAPPAGKVWAERVLYGVSHHFDELSSGRAEAPPPELLQDIDRTFPRVASVPAPAERRSGMLALVGLRRALFPKAPAYQPPAPREAAS